MRDPESPGKEHTLKKDRWSEQNWLNDDGPRETRRVTLDATWYIILWLRWLQRRKLLVREASEPVLSEGQWLCSGSGSSAGSSCRNRK